MPVRMAIDGTDGLIEGGDLDDNDLQRRRDTELLLGLRFGFQRPFHERRSSRQEVTVAQLAACKTKTSDRLNSGNAQVVPEKVRSDHFGCQGS